MTLAHCSAQFIMHNLMMHNRENEIEWNWNVCVCLCVSTYIYIYLYIFSYSVYVVIKHVHIRFAFPLINIYLFSVFEDWRENQCAKHTLVELLYVSGAGIGPELCHSIIKYSPTSSVLLSWCSLGGGRRMDLFCVCRRSFLSLLLTTCPWLIVHRWDWEEVLLNPPSTFLYCLYLCEQLYFFFIFHCVCGCFYLWSFSGVE